MAAQQPATDTLSCTKGQVFTLMDLPKDVLLRIYSHLSASSKYNFRLSCQSAAEIARQHTTRFVKTQLSTLYARLAGLQQSLGSRYPKLKAIDLDISLKLLAEHQSQTHHTEMQDTYTSARSSLAKQGDKPSDLQQMMCVLGCCSSSVLAVKLRLTHLGSSPALVHTVLPHFTSLHKLQLSCDGHFEYNLHVLSELPFLKHLAIDAVCVSKLSLQTIPFGTMSVTHLDLGELDMVDQPQPALLCEVSSVESLKISCSASSASYLGSFVRCFPNLKHYAQEHLWYSKGDCVSAVVGSLAKSCEVLELPRSVVSLDSNSPVTVVHLQNLKHLDVWEVNYAPDFASNVHVLKIRDIWGTMLGTGFTARCLQAFPQLRELHIAFCFECIDMDLEYSLIDQLLGGREQKFEQLVAAIAHVPRLFILASVRHLDPSSYFHPIIQQPNVCGLTLVSISQLPQYLAVLPHVQHLQLPCDVALASPPLEDACDAISIISSRVIALCDCMPSLQSLDVPGAVCVGSMAAKLIVRVATVLAARRLLIVLSGDVADDVVHWLNLEIDAEPGTGCVVRNGPSEWD